MVSPSIVPFSQLEDESRRLHEIFSAEYNTCISNLMVYNLTCKKVNKSLCTWKYTFHSGCKSALAFTLSAVRSPKLNIVFNWKLRSRWTQQPWWDLISLVSNLEASAIQRRSTLRHRNWIQIMLPSFTTDSPDTICKLNFLPWQSKNEYDQLLSENPSCILTPATSAAILASRNGNSNDNDTQDWSTHWRLETIEF